MAAMSVAIDYRPERIVLLSDGEFDPTCSATITMMNKQYSKSARIDPTGGYHHRQRLCQPSGLDECQSVWIGQSVLH